MVTLLHKVPGVPVIPAFSLLIQWDMASIPKVTSWSKIAALAPVIMPTFQPSGRKKSWGKKWKGSRAHTNYLEERLSKAFISPYLHLIEQTFATEPHVRKLEMKSSFWKCAAWKCPDILLRRKGGNRCGRTVYAFCHNLCECLSFFKDFNFSVATLLVETLCSFNYKPGDQGSTMCTLWKTTHAWLF